MGRYADAGEWYERLTSLPTGNPVSQVARLGRARAIEHFDPASAVDAYTELVQREDGKLLAECLLGRARALRMVGRPKDALTDLARAEPIASNDVAVEIRDTSAVIHATLGHMEEAKTFFTTLERECRGTPMHATSLIRLGSVAYYSGHIGEAKDLAVSALSRADDQGTKRYASMNLAWFLCLLGEWEKAEQILEEAMSEASKASDLWLLIPMMTSAGTIAAWQGQFDKAWDLGAQVLRMTSEDYLTDRLNALAVLGLVLLERGDADEAVTVLTPVPDLVERSSEKNEIHQSLMILGESLLLSGDIDSAVAVLHQAGNLLKFNPGWEATHDRLEAQIMISKGSPHLALVLEERWPPQSVEMAIERGRISEVLASAYHSLGDRDAAIRNGERAFETFDTLGSRVRAEHMSMWLSSRRPGRPGRPRSARHGDLSSREAEVLRFLSRGWSNQEIATELFISPGTIRKHIDNIKVKTGIRRRSELIAYGASLTNLESVVK